MKDDKRRRQLKEARNKVKTGNKDEHEIRLVNNKMRK